MGVGRGPQGDDHIPDLHIIPDAAGGADADDGIHTEELVQLIAVNTHRGHAHTVAHDGDALALVGAGVAQHVPDGVEAHHLLQIVVRHVLGPQGVAGHQHSFCNLALFRRDRGGWGFLNGHF
ncbi:Uncharacterised protein [uncultured Blautia sp.]|nr:Uncharacterised protein [uncultured Blautia sp.]